MRDCYVAAGWDNGSKLPLWLPRSSQEPGTLEQLIETWFPTAKDKITIIFEYINTDIKTSPLLAPDIPPQVRTTNKEITYTSHSTTQLISSSSQPFSSSPPLLAVIPTEPSVKNKPSLHKSPVHDSDYRNDTSESSDSSLLSLAELISQVQEISKISGDEVNLHCTRINQPASAPFADHNSESSLSSLPSTPPLSQPQLAGCSSSLPHISLLSDPLLATAAPPSPASPNLAPVSPPGLSSLCFVLLTNYLSLL